jgi:hypothetical protein
MRAFGCSTPPLPSPSALALPQEAALVVHPAGAAKGKIFLFCPHYNYKVLVISSSK